MGFLPERKHICNNKHTMRYYIYTNRTRMKATSHANVSYILTYIYAYRAQTIIYLTLPYSIQLHYALALISDSRFNEHVTCLTCINHTA